MWRKIIRILGWALLGYGFLGFVYALAKGLFIYELPLVIACAVAGYFLIQRSRPT
ncbi:MAG: hypothetical protein ACOC7P_00295 [Chloroflexota bacterium]